MGKRTLDSIYMKLGQTEMDDMAEGIKALWSRPYFDKTRVGIHGSSYGGYTSAMQILRHPDVFAAASAASPVTSWHHYDTIYTERYMRTPGNNPEGYRDTAPRAAAANLHGKLLLMHGGIDDNVHAQNTLQMAYALQQAGKPFRLMVYPKARHGVTDAAQVKHLREGMLAFIEETLLAR